jgi:hypothetical protein
MTNSGFEFHSFMLLAVSILFIALLLNHVHVNSNTSIISIPDQLRRFTTKMQKYPQLGKDARQNGLEFGNPATDPWQRLKGCVLT